MSADARYFASPAAFRAWLEAHHDTATELWVGFYKVGSGKPSLTWPQAVDEALCFGWIDGVRKRIDDQRYVIRFTPRKRGSVWSEVNVRRAEVLTAQGRMHPAGLEAFAARDETKTAQYSLRSADTRPRPGLRGAVPRERQGVGVLQRAGALLPASGRLVGGQRQA